MSLLDSTVVSEKSTSPGFVKLLGAHQHYSS